MKQTALFWSLTVHAAYIVGHLEDHEMEKYLASARIRPLGNTVKVKLTWGYGPQLVTKMEEISTVFRRSSSFRLVADEETHEHVKGELVPLRIGEDEDKKIRHLVERYILNVVHRHIKGFPEFYRSETGGSEVSYNLLEIVCRFHRSSFGKVLNPLLGIHSTSFLTCL
jgi:hypothetical protein